MKEEAVTFGATNSLVGVLADPVEVRSAAARIGVILLNAGILHRVGPGRIYVKIARDLRSLGFTSLRFDFSGIGDSKPRQDNLPFDKSSIDETQSAMDFLQTKLGIRRFVLMGGCSGARVSFAAAASDPRVAGCILINFQVTSGDERDPDPKSNTRNDEHYYLKFALHNSQSWRKLFTGRADYHKLFSAMASGLRRRLTPRKSVIQPPQWIAFRVALKKLVECSIKPIFVCAEGDPASDELQEAGGRDLADLCARSKMEVVVIPRSDHTFSSLADQDHLIKVIREKVSEVARFAPSRQEKRTRLDASPEPPLGKTAIHVQ